MSNAVLAFLAILASAGLDIVSNLLLGLSEGFKKPLFGVGALLLVSLAFCSMAVAIRLGMDLSVAYAMWGSLGILGTSLGAWAFLGQRLRPTAWLGMGMLITGVILLQTA